MTWGSSRWDRAKHSEVMAHSASVRVRSSRRWAHDWRRTWRTVLLSPKREREERLEQRTGNSLGP